jgi:hypothetical protein
MPFAKIYSQRRFDEERQGRLSAAVQDALMNTLGVPPDDFFSGDGQDHLCGHQLPRPRDGDPAVGARHC